MQKNVGLQSCLNFPNTRGITSKRVMGYTLTQVRRNIATVASRRRHFCSITVKHLIEGRNNEAWIGVEPFGESNPKFPHQ